MYDVDLCVDARDATSKICIGYKTTSLSRQHGFSECRTKPFPDVNEKLECMVKTWLLK